MKWPRNLKEALSPLIILTTVFGFFILEYPLDKRRPWITFFYVFCCATFYWIIFKCGSEYLGINVFSNPTINKNLNGVVIAILTYINNFIATSSLIIFWYQNKVKVNIFWKSFYKKNNNNKCYLFLKLLSGKDLMLNIRRLNLMDDTLEYLEQKKDYRNLFLKTLFRVMLWFLIACFLILVDIFRLFKVLNPYQLLYCVYIFHAPLHLNAIIDLTFVIIVENLISKLKIVNKLLLEVSETISPLKIKGCKSRKIIGFEESIRDGLFPIEKRTLIQILRNLNLDVNNLSQNVYNIFKVQIAMEIAAHLALITGFVYNLYSLIMSQMEMNSKIISFFRILSWCSIYIIRILSISNACANINDEARKTGQALIQLDISTRNIEIRTEIELFLLQLVQHPLRFKLDYTIVRRLVGLMTTYLVILIQMHPDNSKN